VSRTGNVRTSSLRTIITADGMLGAVRAAFAGLVRTGRASSLRYFMGYGRGCSSPLVPRRSVRCCGSRAGKRRPEPHGHGSFRPSFSTSSVSRPTTRSPDLTWVSLEGTPGGACWSIQKDASASWSRYMTVLPGWNERQDRSRVGRRRRANNLEQLRRQRSGLSHRDRAAGHRLGDWAWVRQLAGSPLLGPWAGAAASKASAQELMQ
jgi:hypothetical protein